MANDTNHGKAAWEAVLAAGRVEGAADGKAHRMTLTGRRGEALESFWAGRTTAREALTAMEHNIPSGSEPSAAPFRCAGGIGCACEGHPHAAEVWRPESVKPAHKCWLCDGTGQVITAVAEEGRRRWQPVTDGQVKAETCMACLGTGRG